MKNNIPSFASSHPEAKDKKIIIDLSASGEEKQKEILDSIYYARRIQLAQIPDEKRVYGMMQNSKSRKSD